jgi:hypothetical protein
MTNLYDLEPVLIDNIFSDDQYSDIYKIINRLLLDIPNTSPEKNDMYASIPELGYFAVFGSGYFSEKIFTTIVDKTVEAVGLPVGKPEIHFARYTRKTGFDPRLDPHYDLMLTKPTVTVSIQLDSNIDWELYANEVGKTLKSNQGLIFSGSHQLHWRPEREFLEDDFLDILVCQMAVSEEEFTQEHKDIMSDKHKTKLSSMGYRL